ncbi:protein kinase [Streptomyces sp. NPDC051909]|uniref:serine/threonine-protein kinase n=1 Tax=Streptomyces sp. NPDC051909 TaxID=3154944 RepID=UPI00344635FB
MSSGEYERLSGRYRVVSRLGRGGMGVVWRAVDEVLGREVAVKELRTYNDASGAELEDLRLRMQREARAAARIRHPGVVAVHDVTEHQGRPVIVMELVEGPSLDGVLAERGVIDPREAAGIGAAVLEALAAAHEAGVLHRDVKPGNVLLDRGGPAGGGRVVLTDFGIAAMEDPDDGNATHLTRSGEIVGSLDYLAPERAQGRQPGPASDVWALGATLYAAVEGTSPFRRTSTWSTLNAIVVEPLPTPLRAGPLTPVLLRLLDKDPSRRPDARTAAGLLRAVAAGDTGPAAGPGLAPPPAAGAPGPTAPTAPAGSLPGVPGAVPAQPWTPTAQEPVPPRPETGGPAGPLAQEPGTPWAAGGGPAAPPAAPAQGWTPAGRDVVPPGTATGGPAAPLAAPAQAWTPTEPGAVPRPPQGFGPAVAPVAMSAPAPVGFPGGAATASVASGEQGGPGGGASVTAGRPARRRSGALVAAAAVAGVLLVGGGVTYALLDRDSGDGREPTAGGEASGRPTGDPGRVLDPGKPGGGATADGRPTASATPSREGGRPSASPSAPTDSAPPASSAPPGTRPTTAPTPGRTGGTKTAPAPAPSSGGGCTAKGGGKYDCQVWRTEKTYRHDGGEMGILNAGTNYFYCQVDLGRRETYGQWTNIWWARTDDDSGNTNVYFSVVYIKGGNNDQPVPGLPIC